MASSTLSYSNSVGVLSTLFASSSSFFRLSLQINVIRGLILGKDAPSPNIYSAQPVRTPATLYAYSTIKGIPCPGQLPGYFYFPLLAGGSELVISQPPYDIKLEFIYHDQVISSHKVGTNACFGCASANIRPYIITIITHLSQTYICALPFKSCSDKMI